MKTKFALQRLYEPYFRLDGDGSSLEYFFTSILGVTDGNWEIYVDELKELKTSSCENADNITVIYRALDNLQSTMDALSKERLK
jgi:hypothetical protein